ncbi:MAG: hypothetical protein LQ337_004082 [Flavoplaca oasis]|nr:MAG: hypothetical protein LQ337_004082 [Flavoplaca oasis]
MPCTMFSRVAVLFALAASALAAPEPTTTAAIQSFLSISNVDATQASDISTRFEADKASYYTELRTDADYTSALGVAATGMPASAKVEAAKNPELFLVSLAQASSGDLPDWYTALPTDVQDVWRSVGDQYLEMYTSEVHVVRPLSAEVASSLSSVVKSIKSSATSKAAAATSEALGAANAAAPVSPLSSGKMGIVAGCVGVAAGLVGMALL